MSKRMALLGLLAILSVATLSAPAQARWGGGWHGGGWGWHGGGWRGGGWGWRGGGWGWRRGWGWGAAGVGLGLGLGFGLASGYWPYYGGYYP
jgi:hypothetical protein